MPNKKPSSVSRGDFFKQGAAVGAGATILAEQAAAQGRRGQIHFDQVVDVVVVGAGASGLPAAIMAREQGASVIVIDSNQGHPADARDCDGAQVPHAHRRHSHDGGRGGRGANRRARSGASVARVRRRVPAV